MIKRRWRSGSEQGAALVIAIFSLLLISVVATALIVTSGTQSAIKSNYKSAMQSFYDAKAGLEEARGRLWGSNPDSIPVLNCVFPSGGFMTTLQACYIINPAAGENVNPTDPANPYFDSEYSQEWGNAPPSGAALIPSTSANGAPAGPLYKWVRITPQTESSANYDVDGDGPDTTPLFFDGTNVFDSKKGLPGGPVLTITSFAVTPSGSRRMLQYTVAAGSLAAAIPSFPSALTLDGNGVAFAGTSKGGFAIDGDDMDAPAGTPSGVSAIGFTNSSDSSNISGSAVPASNYLSPSGMPAVSNVSVPPVLQTPASLIALVQGITQNADSVITGPVTLSDANNIMPSGMSATNPMSVVVNGDLTIKGWNNTGYGLLLVTGQLKFDPDASWDGIILVIGKGQFISNQNGFGQISGVVFVAQTLDPSSGKPLSSLGPASFSETGGGKGIHYSGKWVAAAQTLAPYQVLSFREIAQTTP